MTLDGDRITTTTRHPDETATRLQAWLGRTLGPDSHPAVTELSSPASNGMSSETVLFTAAGTIGGNARNIAWWPASSRRPPPARCSPPTTSACSSG